MSRPAVQTAKPADSYAAPTEKIVEFFDKDTQRGGLISILRREDGTLNVGVYNMDDGISVSCPTVTTMLKALRVIGKGIAESLESETKPEYARLILVKAQAHAFITANKAEGKS